MHKQLCLYFKVEPSYTKPDINNGIGMGDWKAEFILHKHETNKTQSGTSWVNLSKTGKSSIIASNLTSFPIPNKQEVYVSNLGICILDSCYYNTVDFIWSLLFPTYEF